MIIKGFIRIFYVAIFVFIFAVNCKNESEEKFPEITFIAPSELSLFKVNDTIAVKAEISAESPIENVTLDLKNEDFIAAHTSYSYNPNTNFYLLEEDYFLNNSDLPSGKYYLHLSATAGGQTKNKYIEIEIMGLHKAFNGLILITSENKDPSYSIVMLNESLDHLTTVALDVDVADAEIIWDQGLFYIAGINDFDLRAYNISNLSTNWFIEPFPVSPFHPDNCLVADDQYIYSAYYYDNIKGYNQFGNTIFTTNIDESALVDKMHLHEELLISDQQNKNGGDSFLVTYFLASGTEKQRYLTNFNIIDFVSVTNENIYLFYSDNNGYGIKNYNPYSNIMTDIEEFSFEILDIASVNENTLFILSTDGLYNYEISSQYLTQSITNSEAEKISYEPIDNTIIVYGSNFIKVYQLPNFILTKQTIVSGSIENLLLNYRLSEDALN